MQIVGSHVHGKIDLLNRFAVILPLMLLFGLCSNLTYALVGSLLRQWLADPEHAGRRLRWFNRSMAAVLVATAGWMSTF